MTIDRYDLYCGENSSGLTAHPKGEWVKHEDYVKSLEKVLLFYSIPSEERENGAWKDLIREIT